MGKVLGILFSFYSLKTELLSVHKSLGVVVVVKDNKMQKPTKMRKESLITTVLGTTTTCRAIDRTACKQQTRLLSFLPVWPGHLNQTEILVVSQQVN